MALCRGCGRDVMAEDAEPVAVQTYDGWNQTECITLDIEIWCNECAREIFEDV